MIDIRFNTLAMAIYAATVLILNKCDFNFSTNSRGIHITLHQYDAGILDNYGIQHLVCDPS